MREIDAGASPHEPMYASIFEALDNAEARMHFMRMLGFEPKYDDKGNLIGWEEVAPPTFRELLFSTLTMMSSKKVMGIAQIEDAEPLTELQIKMKVETILDLIDIITPPDEDMLPYLPAIEWAKLEMDKALTLANRGMLFRALIGAPIVPEQEIPQVEIKPPEERKKGLLERLLGGGRG